MIEIYKYLKLSKFSILGYTSKYERVKDDIISNLNHIIVNDPNKATFESLIREDKINQINDEKENYEYLVVDLMNLKDRHFVPNRVKLVESRYKILLICLVYRSFKNNIQLSGGDSLLYNCDFAFTVGESIQIIKNRWEAPIEFRL